MTGENAQTTTNGPNSKSLWESIVINIKKAGNFYYGQFLLSYLKYRHRRFLQNLSPLAAYLEEQIFPTLRELDDKKLVLCIPQEEKGNDLSGHSGTHEYTFPGTDAVTQALREKGIEKVELSTRLESGQILESLLLLLHAAPLLHTAEPTQSSDSWDRRAVASAMNGPYGFHKFCALMRYSPPKKSYQVEYHYCELFFTRVVKSYLNNFTRHRDHRSLYRTAFQSALAAFLFLLIPAIMIERGFLTGMRTLILVSLFVSFGIWFAVRTLASVQYDKEHRDWLTKDYMKRIAILSRYPEFNPNLIFRLDFEGKILYHNPAVEQFIKKFGSPASSMAELLPHSVQEYVEQCIGPRQGNCQVEVERFGRAIHYNISTFQDQRSLFVDGTDVTRMKDLERDLRELNQNLEQKVQERTDELRQTQDVTIVGLAGLAETRDPETGEHLERTRMYVKTLAVTLQDHPRFRRELTDQTIDSLYKSTPLHDIGKVGIRDAVLRKPGRLTDDEFEEMKLHAIHGGKALEKTEEKLGFDSFLRIAKEIAYYHHEKWDGSGYPFGLKEDAIPVAARLMAIADVYDALVSKRVYKDAFPHEKAVSIISEGKGKHFDPDMVEAFMKIHEQFQAIVREYKDEEENDLYGKKLNEYTKREQE